MPNAHTSRLTKTVRILLCTLLFHAILTVASTSSANDLSRPNILLITMDDMNWDSIGSYDCNLADISPNIDGLAKAGMRFQHAYVQTSSCAPSRTTLQTGRYPHSTGILSFYNVDAPFPSLPEVLKDNGYFTACVNKPRDSSLTDDYGRYWDYHHTMTDGSKRGATTYAASTTEAIAAAQNQGRPFYCVVNIADPHKPFFNDPASIAKGFDDYAPSKTYSSEEITVPAFLPNVPEIREEIRNYYNSVRRGDDCVGAVLDTLQASDLQEDTVIFFLSDHGMPLPFAKSSVYPDGVRTPWIIVWPDKKQAGTVDSHHLVSAIDFMPTILDITGTEHPDGLQGRSLLPLTEGRTETDRDRVFVEFNDNAGGIAYPMRAIHTKDFVYIFNAWATGKNDFLSAATWYQSEKAMKRLASSDDSIAKRYDFLLHRCPEELYRTSIDPHCLHNLIDDPQHQRVCRSMQEDLLNWMKSTDDYLQEAFEARKYPVRLQAIYEQLDSQSLRRAKTLQWKRDKNRAGGTEKNMALFPASAHQGPAHETARTFMLEKGDLLFADDFTTEKPLTKPRWWPKQGTQWSITNGTLVGTAATREYQTQRQQIGHHLGDIPRIGMGKLPRTYVLACRFQIDDRPGNSKVPLIEFGHHVSRIYFGKSGAVLLTNHEKATHTRLADFRLKPFQWYGLLAEVGKEDLVVQLIDDMGNCSVLYAHEPRFADSENMSFEVATTLRGTAKIDDMKVWSAGATKPNWRSMVQ
jgi:N-sulfoglucosamine sulfohydrolase